MRNKLLFHNQQLLHLQARSLFRFPLFSFTIHKHPCLQVQCPVKLESHAEEPPPKKTKFSTLDGFVAKGNKQDVFLRDLVTAFTAANIPLEKLKKKDDGSGTLLRQFLEKYVRVEGEAPHIPDPCNLRRTHLPKVKEAGVFGAIGWMIPVFFRASEVARHNQKWQLFCRNPMRRNR